MRLRPILFILALATACSSAHPATTLLCTYCNDDSQCAGNPCFQDTSPERFCGAPCDSCPAGYSCQPVTGTRGTVMLTCFPATEACVPPGSGSADMALPSGDLSGPGGDMAHAPPPIPVGGPVSPTGGTVDRLYFGFTGDTRPDQCDGAYPQMVINGIYTRLKAAGVQFAVDQGDHMFNCQAGLVGAKQQMNNYLSAATILGKTVFMTMGNHECTGESSALCATNQEGVNNNYTAFMLALRQQGLTSPYYRFDVKTASGTAVFLVVADDVWDSVEQTWLETQLTDADQHAKYTFVSKHHPDRNNDHPEFQQIYDLVRSHKYTLFLTGHTHEYRRQSSDPRAMVIGCGGAPLAGSNSFWGYGTAVQGTDDRIYVTVYDQATNHVMDQFDVAPQ